ncbi:hypothetical protein [Anoxybacteroides tepidamans]|uniref:hypothetical protein n=1 Tax=Anoxybacteroides tepidamans TaxID=265948 RepID=UPI000488EC9D|nr:hypothetical protein [Anoxybacillus tepidamans]
MTYEEKLVSVYFDTENSHLYFVANGIHEKTGGVIQIHLVNELAYPYSIEDIEEFALKTMDQFDSIPWDGDTRIPLEKYLKIRGRTKVLKNKKLVMVFWTKEKGDEVCPTKNEGRKGYDGIGPDMVLPNDFQPGQLGEAIEKAIELSQL